MTFTQEQLVELSSQFGVSGIFVVEFVQLQLRNLEPFTMISEQLQGLLVVGAAHVKFGTTIGDDVDAQQLQGF